MSGDFLLADIGGTNVRFAVLRGDGRIEAHEAWLTALYPDFGSAVKAYADVAGLRFPLQGAAVCAAGPLVGDEITLTNCPWKISRAEIAAATSGVAYLVNDFAAVAHALPVLTPDDVVQIGGSTPIDGSPKVAIGPGTGLGVASAVFDGARWVAVPGEGGHVDLAPTNDRELAVVFQLMRSHGHVAAEDAVSGPGLEALYLAIAALDGVTLKAKPMAADIAKAARAKTDVVAVEAVALFTGWLGGVAGDLALTLGAQGGVYIAGGIVAQWGDLFDVKLFRRRFEAKGRIKYFLEPIPCYLVTAKDLAFRGLAAMVR
jgi:glucokinase